MGIGFISIFLLKARVLNLTISKRKNLSLPLKVETDQFVIFLVLPESLSAVKICLSSDSEANRDGSDAESPFPLFFSLLRAVCCKDQLRSCNIEKTDFPKLCQNKGLGKLVIKI